MTRLTDFFVRAEPANGHRHADPPNLWLGVIAGSLAIHLLLALSLRWWSLRVAIAQSESSPVPIELVDVDPEAATEFTSESTSESTGAATAATTAQASAETSTPTNNETSVLEPGVTTVTTPESATPSIPLAATPSPNPSPDLSQSAPSSPADAQTALPFTPPVLPSSEPTTNQDNNPNQPIPPTDNTQPPTPTDNSNSPPPNSSALNEPPQPDGNLPAPPASPDAVQDTNGGTTETPDSSGAGAGGETPNNSAPAPSNTSDPGGVSTNNEPSEVTDQVLVSENAVPAQFQASLSTSAPPGVGDLHDGLATPKSSTQTFLSDTTSAFGCSLDPDSVRFFGQSVTLRITVDEQGRVLGNETIVQAPSGSAAYDQLAQCVISTWEFTPAFDRKGDADSPVPSNLDVRVTINSI